MKVEIKQGKNNRWRWFLRTMDNKFKAMESPYGFESKQDAFEDAMDSLQSPVTMYDSDGYEYLCRI